MQARIHFPHIRNPHKTTVVIGQLTKQRSFREQTIPLVHYIAITIHTDESPICPGAALIAPFSEENANEEQQETAEQVGR